MKINIPFIKKYFGLAIVILLVITACNKDKAKPSWNVDLLIPIISDTITVEDILDERFFVENPDQSISLVFNEKLFEMDIDSLVELPDTLFNYGMRMSFMPVPTHHQPGDTVIAQKFFLPINLQYGSAYSLLLEKAILKTGDIVFEIFQKSDVDLLVSLKIIGAEHPETGSFSSVETALHNEHSSKAYDIADYHLNLSGPNHDTVNMFTYDAVIMVHPDEIGEVTIYPEDSVSMTIYFQNIILNYTRGYFGRNTFQFGPETYPIELFKDIDVKGVSFEDAEINFTIENTYGLDVNFNIEEVYAKNSSSMDSVLLESPLIGTELYVDRAVEIIEESGDIQSHSVSFDFSDSNFPDLLSIKPDEISYKMSLETNINTDSTLYDNFVYYNKPISVDLDAKVNGGIKVDSLFQSSRMEWNVGGVEVENIESGELKLIFANAFPFDFIMNLYFEDEEMNKIDTLVFHELIKGGNLGLDHFVSSATENIITIPFNDNVKNSFKKAKYTMYELIINSVNGEQVMIHKSDYLKFKVVGDFEYHLEQ